VYSFGNDVFKLVLVFAFYLYWARFIQYGIVKRVLARWVWFQVGNGYNWIDILSAWYIDLVGQ
jgi:hypothetical protein